MRQALGGTVFGPRDQYGYESELGLIHSNARQAIFYIISAVNGLYCQNLIYNSVRRSTLIILCTPNSRSTSGMATTHTLDFIIHQLPL